jgi:predicted phosphodiesterase
LAVVADIRGNAEALQAVLSDAAASDIEEWWALGDLVLFGPRPVEVVELLGELPKVRYVMGNTDRYVVQGGQPSPHATPADAVGSVELVERYGNMAGSIGWTRGALVQAGLFHRLVGLPASVRTVLPDGSRLVGVHASYSADDGPGIDTRCTDEVLRGLVCGCDADIVVGGHTHDATDRVVGEVRALNPGSVGLPRSWGRAQWLVIAADATTVEVGHRVSSFDAGSVAADLHDRGYPSAGFLEGLLLGTAAFVG